MRRCVVDLLACPGCRGSLEVAESHEETSVRVLEGTLRCVACGTPYAIRKGVPRLLKAAADVAETGQRFSAQWMGRWSGRFETSLHCYGVDPVKWVGWIVQQLQSAEPITPGAWMLDAGCGSGEKTEVLARLCSGQNVVGLDLGIEPLEIAAEKFADTPNLDYVQGNILEPPFKSRSFDHGICIGVLHHTPDTRLAFEKLRSILKQQTSLVVWLYPTPREGAEWRSAYRIRDHVLLNKGHLLPTPLLRLGANIMVMAIYPFSDAFFRKTYRRVRGALPFLDVDQMTRRQRFSAQVFLIFDTCLPRYQFRHSVAEVKGWFAEEGLDLIQQTHGFYTGVTAAISPTASAPR